MYSEGADYLAQCLPHMTSLRTLIVRESRIGTRGVKKLAEALDESPGVSLVDVSGNGLTPEGREALQAAFENRDTGHRLIM